MAQTTDKKRGYVKGQPTRFARGHNGRARAAREPKDAAMKVCVECGAEKPKPEFPADPNRKGGLHPYCKPCKASFQRAANAKWKAENPEAYRRAQKSQNLKRMGIGMTIEIYEAMLAEQGGRCLICKDQPDPMALAVDHCHETGRVRGLLCRGCNVGLGHFTDDPERLRAAADYLELAADD